MTLVQLLRHNEHSNIHEGLIAESLSYATLQGGIEFQNYLEQRRASGKPTALKPDSEPALITTRNGAILDILLNRPQHHNAYSVAMRDQLIEALQILENDPSIDKAIIRGAGDCFCIGGDLNEFGSFGDSASAHAIRSTRNAGKLISALAERIEFHVHRACIGSGIELPAFCYRVVATEDTFFQLPEITLGMVPGAGGTVSITRRIGRQRTAWMGLSAKKINATKALEWGLIDQIE